MQFTILALLSAYALGDVAYGCPPYGCYGSSCDDIAAETGYTCSTMEADGCYCGGCDCIESDPTPTPTATPSPSPESACCDETCIGSPSWASDGYCDDGGEGAEYSGCLLGTDCVDCGVRCTDWEAPSPPPPSPPSPPPPPDSPSPPPSSPSPPFPPPVCCDETCIGSPSWASDGFCDDGGSGAEYSGCDLGTDCADCGDRCDESPPPAPPRPPPDGPSPPSPPSPPAPPSAPPTCCDETCIGSPTWASDGYCDDGGEGAEYSGCELGTDCVDCGDRCLSGGPGAPPSPPEECPATCYSQTCDYWGASAGAWSCDDLESTHSCNCFGCASCTSPPPSPSPSPPPPLPPPPPSPSPPPPPPEEDECLDKSGSKKCKKVVKKDQCAKKAKKCELSCGVCGAAPPPPPDCDNFEDKKGSKWCGKKTKTAKKWSKLCTSSKAKKCESTCCDSPFDR